MDSDDFDFGESKSRAAKVGRRAKKSALETDTTAEEDEVLASVSAPKMSEGAELDGPPKPSRRMSGWATESAPLRLFKKMKNSPSARRRGGDADDFEDLMPFEEGYFESRTLPSERLRPQTPTKDEESDGEPDIPTIPDLDDQADDDLTAQVAMAPNVVVNRVATYRELDNDLLRHAAFLTLDNEIDLKLLSRGLSAEGDVHDPDVPWDWDRLFTEVTSDLMTEWESKEVAEEETQSAAVA